MSTWSDFWSEVMTPDRFRDDPYGEATNQISHAALGAISALICCVVWREISGEMPYRWQVFAVIAVSYTLIVEVLLQRWSAWDSAADSLFVMTGAAAALLPVKEIAAHEARTVIELEHRTLGAVFLFMIVILLIRVIPRARLKYGG